MTTLTPATIAPETDPAGITALFDNSDWQPFQSDFQKIRSFLPNRIYHNKSKQTAALVVQRAVGGDFALSQRALRVRFRCNQGWKARCSLYRNQRTRRI